MTVIEFIRELSYCDPNKEVRVFINNLEADYEITEKKWCDHVELKVKI